MPDGRIGEAPRALVAAGEITAGGFDDAPADLAQRAQVRLHELVFPHMDVHRRRQEHRRARRQENRGEKVVAEPVPNLATAVDPPSYTVRVNQEFVQLHGTIDRAR